MLALVSAPSARSHDTDLPLLLDSLAAEGADAVVVDWDDNDVDWSQYEAAVIRSTWDYHRRLADFDRWLHIASSSTRLWNPVELIRWNIDKRYLTEVASWGVPVVPTTVVTSRAEVDPANLSGDVVVKPSVGAGANGARRIIDDPAAALAHVDHLLGGGSAVLIQPYLSDVDARGETGIVTVGHRFSHAFGKAAILSGGAEWTDDLYVTEQIEAREASAVELDIVEAILRQLPQTAYARIDLLPAASGPVVSEIELIEPSLFLHVEPNAADRVAAVFARLSTR